MHTHTGTHTPCSLLTWKKSRKMEGKEEIRDDLFSGRAPNDTCKSICENFSALAWGLKSFSEIVPGCHSKAGVHDIKNDSVLFSLTYALLDWHQVKTCSAQTFTEQKRCRHNRQWLFFFCLLSLRCFANWIFYPFWSTFLYTSFSHTLYLIGCMKKNFVGSNYCSCLKVFWTFSWLRIRIC